MGNDLISREALKKAIKDSDIIHCVTNLWYTDILKEIDNAPTIDPKQGEWVKVKEYRMCIAMSGEIATLYKCSECGRMITILPSNLADYPFCHCGAKMKGGEEECWNRIF